MGKPKMPETPDPQEVAAAQTQSNRETAITQTGLNAMDQFGPGGSLTYNQVGEWADGTPRFQQTTALSPEQQSIYDTNVGTQTNLANLAQQQSGRLGDLLGSGMPDGPELSTIGGDESGIQMSLGDNDFSADRQRVEDALFERLTPQLDRDRQNLQSSLAQQGITPGSSAYDRRLSQFDRSVNDARTGVLLNAGTEQSRLQGMALNAGNFANQAQAQRFGQGLSNAQFGNQALQQMFGNELGLRNQGLNEIIGLASGSQVQNPQFAQTPQTGVGGVDVAGIHQQNYANQMQAYNNAQANIGGMFGTLGNVIGGALGAPASSVLGSFILSDERAKTDMERVGKTDSGTPIYTYQYKGDPSGATHMGVKAQDVPEASVPMGSLLAVDYKKVK